MVIKTILFNIERDITTHLETEVMEENISTIIKETILIKEEDIKKIDMQELMEIIDLI